MKKAWSIFFNIFIFIITGVIVFKALSPFYHGLVVGSDSLVGPFWGSINHFSEFLNISDHSWIIMSILWKVTGRLIPECLSMHPQVWYANYYYWILFGMMIILLLAIWRNLVKYFKNKNFSSLWILLILPIIGCFIQNTDTAWYLCDDVWSYAYFFLPAFFIVFYSEIEKYYIKNDFQKTSTFHKVVLFLLLVCIGLSHEFPRFVLCSSVFIGYILHLIFINKDLNHKKFWLFYSGLVIINTAIFLSPDFQRWFGQRHNSLAEIVEKMHTYLSSYCHYILLDNWVMIVGILAILALILICSNSPKLENEYKSESKKIGVFAISTTFSILIFSLFIMIGEEYGFSSCEHSGIRLLTKIFLLNVILSELGWFLSVSKNNICKIVVATICFSALIFQAKLQSFDKFTHYIEYRFNLRKRVYILERIFDKYGKENKVFLYTGDDCPQSTIAYFIFLYDRDANPEEYEKINICDGIDLDDYEKCNQKLLDFYKEKTGLTISKDELNKLDFQKYYRY